MQNLHDRYLKAKRALFEKAYGELNPEQRKAVYAASDAENALYRDEIVATVGEQGYLDLIRQYPFY